MFGACPKVVNGVVKHVVATYYLLRVTYYTYYLLSTGSPHLQRVGERHALLSQEDQRAVRLDRGPHELRVLRAWRSPQRVHSHDGAGHGWLSLQAR